jgi:uncharacterized protein (DUF433 family)
MPQQMHDHDTPESGPPGSENIPNIPGITVDPNIMAGKPTLTGTRLTVELILEELASGATTEELLANYPRLTVKGLLLRLPMPSRRWNAIRMPAHNPRRRISRLKAIQARFQPPDRLCQLSSQSAAEFLCLAFGLLRFVLAA